jgi:hypothetical protein
MTKLEAFIVQVGRCLEAKIDEGFDGTYTLTLKLEGERPHARAITELVGEKIAVLQEHKE